MQTKNLNKNYGITDQLVFTTDQSDFIYANIQTAQASATISLYGGQVLSYKPANASDDLMFLSEHAYYKKGKAIKGGIPICWPWFGADPEGKGRPAHGFARNSEWTVLETAVEKNGSIRLSLELNLNDTTRKLWEGDISARLDVVAGDNLALTLTTFNNSKDEMQLTQALHTYFNVGDSTQVSVTGLGGKTYLDKADGGGERIQQGPVTISGEVDRIYTDINNDLVIHDSVLERKIRIQSNGSASAVVWNPWKEIAAEMGDLGDTDYLRMLCVETTNAGPDIVTIAPGDPYKLSAVYRVE
ncbi:MAG: D-hexose-6-phosphate mutarotase [Gammaproteobacteria bacterium]